MAWNGEEAGSFLICMWWKLAFTTCGPGVAQVLGLEACSELESMDPEVSVVGVFS